VRRVPRPNCEELRAALEELVAVRGLERDVLHDDWTRGSGLLGDEDDRRAIERMDRDLARYRDLLRRAKDTLAGTVRAGACHYRRRRWVRVPGPEGACASGVEKG